MLISEAEKLGFTLEGFNEKRLNEKLAELEKFKPFCELVKVVSRNFYDGKNHFEHVNVLIKYKDFYLVPQKRYNEKSFTFYFDDNLHASHYKCNVPMPSKVGSPTAKKLDLWIDYLIADHNAKQESLNTAEAKKTAYLDKLKATGLKINFRADGLSGWIDTNPDLEFFFSIDEFGNVTEKITPKNRTLETFLKLTTTQKK